MTDLQMSLIAAGGVFIVGVFTYNKWQEHKAKKSVERAFSSDHDDVLMRAADAAAPAPRHEPSFSLDTEPGLAGGEASAAAAASRQRAKIIRASATRIWSDSAR